MGRYWKAPSSNWHPQMRNMRHKVRERERGGEREREREREREMKKKEHTLSGGGDKLKYGVLSEKLQPRKWIAPRVALFNLPTVCHRSLDDFGNVSQMTLPTTGFLLCSSLLVFTHVLVSVLKTFSLIRLISESLTSLILEKRNTFKLVNPRMKL